MPVFGAETPVGAGMIWYTNTAPANWLICDGSAVSRTTYAKLFGVLSTTYGTGDGSTTFNLPDLRQRFPMGKAASGTGNTLAGTGGAVDHAHTSAAHTHTVPAHYHSMGTGADLNITSSGSHTHTFGIYAITGGGGTSAGVAAQGGTGGPTYYSISTDSHTHASGAFAGKIGLVTGGVDGNASMTSGSTTPSNTGTNNPPYLVVNYIIKAA